MTWEQAISDFQNYLKLERSMSLNTIDAYKRDLFKFSSYLIQKEEIKDPLKVKPIDIQSFLGFITEADMSARSQSRNLSSIKGFYKYLIIDDYLSIDPSELIHSPKVAKKLPEFLTKEEIDQLIDAIDLSTDQGHRNKAMIEMLYSCGLRVSELINLTFSNLFIKEGVIRVLGKGNKERLVPINPYAVKQLKLYTDSIRKSQDVQRGYEDFIFLNRRGKSLSRAMIFQIIKDLSTQINLQKKIGPHTFRHSFATHLVEGGANLRAVQELLGHESITTTEIYTHLNQDYLKSDLIQFHPRANKD